MPKQAARAEPFLRRVLPWLMFIAALLLTLCLAAWSVKQNAEHRAVLMEHRIEAFRLSLAASLRAHLDILPGLRLTAGQAPLTDARFARYVDNVLGGQRYPGLTLSFIAERVSEAERTSYLARVREDRSTDPAGHASFEIQPPGARPEYMLLRHQHPADPTNDGYDLYDPAQRYRQPIARAIASGHPVATPPLRLARDRHRPDHPELTSIVVRAATYRGDALPVDPVARRDAATGVVGIALRGAPLVRDALPQGLSAEARVRVTDPQAPADAPVVYDSQPGAPAMAEAHRFMLPVADRQWEVAVAPPPASWWLDVNDSTVTLLVGGFACALALMGLTTGLGRIRHRAEARVRDGLARLEAEKAQLTRSENRLRQLFENSLDAVLNTRPGGGVVAANRTACELFGRSEAQLVAAARGDLLDLNDPRLAPLLAERQATGRMRGQLRMRRADGSTFEAEVSSMTYQDGDGQPLASVIVRDLSASLDAAAERQRLEEQLRHAQKMQALGTLAGGIAHDFNNVLAIVLGGAALLDAELPPGHAARPHLERVRQAGLRARSLVQQLLTFGRPSTEGRWAQPLRPLVEETLALLRLSLPATVTLKADLPDKPLHVVTEPSQLQQVLLNLCNNAWQAMPGHQGCIEIMLRPRHHDGRDWALLSVRDDGAGMDAALRQRIFEPFFTTKSPGQGTGLGLAMVHGIVTGHGGHIELSSMPGHGSVFEIWLPAVEGAVDGPAGDAPPPHAGGARGHGERIVYLDDDEVLRLTVEALLQRLGYAVRTFGDPAAALAAVDADPTAVDLLLTDYDMPGMSGLEVARTLRGRHAALPVLIVTGQVTQTLRDACAALPGVGVLPKEYIAEQLGARLAALLAARDPRH